MNPVISDVIKSKIDNLWAPKHPGSICIANYKGGVGKTTLSCLLAYYLADIINCKVLLFDIDPQCSLSLAVGFDPEEVSRQELTVYNLVKPSKWTKITKTNFGSYAVRIPDNIGPKNLYIVKGSFDIEDLDIEITKSVVTSGEKRIHELYLYCKQMLQAFEDYKFIIIDCPPNRMFLTQAMLRASSYYLPVTIPDEISIYGMPRLLRWVNKISSTDRPKMLGYVLNAVNRIGGPPGGMVYSQQASMARLEMNIKKELDQIELHVIGDNPNIGVIPRLDIIARFLNERNTKYSKEEFKRQKSGQESVDACLTKIMTEVIKRIHTYREKN